MDLGLDGKHALVAAGTSGLGLAVARALAAEGAHVAVASRSEERVQAAVDEIKVVARSPDVEVRGSALDVRDGEAVGAWVQETAEAFGGLHIVVANAGGPPPGKATDFDLDAYRDALELNLLSSIRLVQLALPWLRASGWGRVLFVTSLSVKQPIPHLALSNTARPGVVGFAKSLVHDLGAGNITVNVLAPGAHRTPRLQHAEGADRPPVDRIPLGRIGEPAGFGAVAAFLASEPASFVTGAVVPVDGGAYLGLT